MNKLTSRISRVLWLIALGFCLRGDVDDHMWWMVWCWFIFIMLEIKDVWEEER